MFIKQFSACILLTLLIFSNACTNQADIHSTTDHLKLSDDVIKVMRRLDRLVFEREVTELELDRLRKEGSTQLLSNLNQLINSLQRMQTEPAYQSHIAIFEQSTDELKHHAASIQSALVDKDTNALAASLARLPATCDSCHRQHLKDRE